MPKIYLQENHLVDIIVNSMTVSSRSVSLKQDNNNSEKVCVV